MVKNIKSQKTIPARKKDLPATVGFVTKVRDELKLELLSVKHELKSEIHGVKADVHGLKAEVKSLGASIHRMEAMMEQQYSENRIVLEQLVGLSQRQDRLEKRQDESDQILRTLARAKSKSN